MKKTVAQAQKHYDQIVAENEKRIANFQSRINARIESGHGHAEIDKELSQFLTIAARGEAIAQKGLDEALAEEKGKTEAAAQELKVKTENANNKLKEQAFKSYTKSGGKPEEFDSAWPALRAKMLEASVVQDITDPQQRPPTLINGL